MDKIRNLITTVLARIWRVDKRPSNNGAPELTDSCAEKIAQVQNALLNGEEVRHISELKTGKTTLRTTLHDMPAFVPYTSFEKERPWFDKSHNDTKRGGSPSNTWNRLEAFLSTTDPNQLNALDPSWNKGLPQAPDDRPQPKQSTIDIHANRRQKIEDLATEPLYEEGKFSNSISGVF